MKITNKIYNFIDYVFKKSKEKNITSISITKLQSNLLKNKVALVIGGTGGIGMGIAQAFLDAGAKVIISGTSQSKLNKSFSKLQGDIRGIVIDLRKVNDFSRLINEAAKLFPEDRIDILVNSAGVHGNEKFGEVTESTYDAVLDVNLKGAFFMIQSMGNYMKKNKIKGHILNVSSAAALKPGYTPYEISKNALKSLTLGAADELIEYGIIVNAIGPGPVATEMLGRKENDTLYTDVVPSKRFATIEEIGQMATIMVSDLCNLVVGDTFYISGGSGTIRLK